MPKPSRWKLTVAGGKKIDSGTNLVMLAGAAVELARRGYVIYVTETTGTDTRKAEVRRVGGVVTVVPPPANGRPDPGWVEQLRLAIRNVI